ncbi:MAG TPA: TetR/AcrR family transcriptional regulator [Actinomycetota bacterium]
MVEAVKTRRRRAPRGHGERLREEILSATEELLIKTGDQEAVSIRAVADAVGVTPPSIYLHFADKTDLIFAVCERHFAKFDQVVEEAGSRSDDPMESLRLRGEAYVRFGLEHPEQYRILFMTKPAEVPDGWSHERLINNAAFGHLVQAVQRCLNAGVFVDGDPVLIASGLWVVVHGLTSLLISDRGLAWPLDDLLKHVIGTYQAGLRRR